LNKEDKHDAAEKAGEAHEKIEAALAPELIKKFSSEGSEYHHAKGGNTEEFGSCLFRDVEDFIVK
jgi:hypothetical protein